MGKGAPVSPGEPGSPQKRGRSLGSLNPGMGLTDTGESPNQRRPAREFQGQSGGRGLPEYEAGLDRGVASQEGRGSVYES